MTDRFQCDLSIRFDPWGFADDTVLEVLLPLPESDGYQKVSDVRAPAGFDFVDRHGHRRLIRLHRGDTADVTARIETRRLKPGAYLSLPPPGPADRTPGPMTAPDTALRALARDSLKSVEGAEARIAALAHAAAGALRYRCARDARGAALSLSRGKGDCGEYAFIFVALCHAAGIPARPVFGLITAPWFRTPHAWAEAWDGTGWLPVDPNFVREGSYFGPLLESSCRPAAHIGGLDPYRVVLSRHTGIPWPGAVATFSDAAPENTLALEGLGDVAVWREAPLWQGAPVVPFLQLPWPLIRRPVRTTPLRRLQRLRVWRVRLSAPSRRLPRNPLVWADVVVLHPYKGIAGALAASLTGRAVPALAPVLDTGVLVWAAVLVLGLLRNLRLARLRSALWLKIEAAFRLDSAPGWTKTKRAERGG